MKINEMNVWSVRGRDNEVSQWHERDKVVLRLKATKTTLSRLFHKKKKSCPVISRDKTYRLQYLILRIFK